MERCDNQFNESPNETAVLGRRQRFMNLVKTTKNVYIPSLTSTISQKTESFRNHEEYQPYSNLTLDTDILYYPTYTTRSSEVYETVVRFVVNAPGNPQSRKNRILMSLCRQYLLPRNITDIDQELLDQKLDDALTASDTKSMLSNGTTDSTLSGTDAELVHSNIVQSECEVLKTRIAGFLERKIANIPAIVDVFTNEGSGHYETSFCTTDNMGYVETRLRTSFEPKKVRITLDTPTEFPKVITHEFPTNCIKAQGFGLISDVDDTIKHTGVTGDKRSMFRNVFVQDFASWNIEGVSRWYRTLKDSRDVDFFYVSNSPMQTYNTLQQYICTNFPKGPLFLKQYSGNILSSIWSSSADRKLGSITQILRDFPSKRFFLVGDSGEQDFEAYISTVLNFPDQVAGIYIRCCKDSLSDMGLRETEVMVSLNEMIKKEYMGEYKKIPPEVPKRKPQLTVQQQEAIALSRPSVTYMRPRPVPPSLPPRPTQGPPPIDMTNTQNGYHNYDTFFDKRAEHWRHRLYVGLQQLKRIRGEGHIRLLFFADPELPLEDSMETMRRG
ncbi:ZYBA0S04-08394g1_1 [Zygosaccharomyces bailii CLIB 213]|uniref:ZYBA0S04-08394g1_1 n=1 Tax=Zygosaccharomyces bailii (strain CLIB 213 / ATCC 58445 / CBS 680 / BCRC 21525 / NBRC 1098 / NCYC 1416 / NRRL Y-2227) TaxID=1333698 RepID=A0A8J2T616_ZYGB2|nr:ZYBA0S04-08394g1_1 [Zygosaccharomyces bailii CLIB 213]